MKRKKLIEQLKLVQEINTSVAASNQFAGQCLSPVANIKYAVEREVVDGARGKKVARHHPCTK
jgi:hypothetical protein